MALFSLPDLREKDFTAHNEESHALWRAFQEKTHSRVPMRLNTNPRILMLDPKYNTRGVRYQDYITDPELMAQAVLEHQYFLRFILPGDHEKGLPERWNLWLDFENLYDAAWFGCPVWYRENQVPDAEPILNDDNKRMLFDRGVPDPFKGEWAERAVQFVDYYRAKCAGGWTYLERPVAPPDNARFEGCDGVFTVAASLRGATELCMDLLTDPGYVHELLDFISTALIARMTAWREYLGRPVRQDAFVMADDSIQLLSLEQYKEFVLPLHRRFYDAFATEKDRWMHLCGNAQRHFPTIYKELGVTAFDTGFPVDFEQFRRALGPDVLIAGGPRVSFFLEEDPTPLVTETKRILESGILEGGRVIMQEGNNLPPLARLPVCEAFYETVKEFGALPS
ncbi:MAG TPA: uroporphyrinogen decarboxylase family protein [Candidatus Hydrogenedentes bacterium]|nr:uroporphyrinogen decarboxylase family protein [Candidatus Hydrogenedentota bacterium]